MGIKKAADATVHLLSNLQNANSGYWFLQQQRENTAYGGFLSSDIF